MRNIFLEVKNPVDDERLRKLKAVVGSGPVLILTHDNPDPDSMASGMALAYLLDQLWQIPSVLVYSGVVARAENQAMLRLLTPVWKHQEQLVELDNYSAIALVDTQPGAGNNRLPAEKLPDVVIDHHKPLREQLYSVPYYDVRPEIGATVSMLYQYFAARDIVPDATLATAMFYGLHTDTRGLARNSSPADEIAYFNLLELLDRDTLIQVEQAGLPREYFQAFTKGLQAAWIFGSAVVADLGVMHRPDFTAEIADVLIRLDIARAVLCMGSHQTTLHFSIRTKSLGFDAGALAQNVVLLDGKAGGHGSVAGGQIPIDHQDAGSLAVTIRTRFLTTLGEKSIGTPLLNEQDL